MARFNTFKKIKKKLDKKPKIRVFKSSSSSDTSRIHVAVPAKLQADRNVKNIKITQVEKIPKPKSLNQLNKVPLTIKNPPLNANKSVQKSLLTKGYKIRAIPEGNFVKAVPPLEIEEVVIPEGYAHVDDIDEWNIYNYNKSYFRTGQDFVPLPGENRLPIRIRYHLIIKGREFFAMHDDPVDNIKVYYRKITKNQLDYEWTFWKSISKNNSSGDETVRTTNIFELDGTYIFRAVPHHNDLPLEGFKQYNVVYEEDESLRWSSIQLDEDTFQIRIEGQLSEKINYLEVYENNTRLASKNLKVDSNGRTETVLRVDGVSDASEPRLEYRFFRKNNAFTSFVTKYYEVLERNFAIEPIGFSVKKSSDTKFTINISDTENILYSPDSVINVFTGSQWNTAIQEGKILAQLVITRHQDGEITPYGKYFINITQEKEPKFINLPPFTDNVRKVSQGFEFDFEDTQVFRDTVGIDNPDFGKKLAYEFRLMFWSAGIEEGLRSGENYAFIKEESVLVRGRKRLYKFVYDTWSEEHPKKKYKLTMPKSVTYSYLNDHIRYGLTKEGFVFSAKRLPIIRTRDIKIDPIGWKVLYYYNDKEDELQEFPYYCFGIEIPPTSILEIEKLEIFVKTEDPKNPNISLGVFHPSKYIEIRDYIGYFETRKSITQKIPLAKTLRSLAHVIDPNKNTGATTRIIGNSPILSNDAQRMLKNQFTNLDSKIGNSVALDTSLPPAATQNNYKSTHALKMRRTRGFNNKTPDEISAVIPSMNNNTDNKKRIANMANIQINNHIAAKAETGRVIYRVDLTFRDGETATESFFAEISERPKLPQDPPENISVATGNRTFVKSTVNLPIEAADAVGRTIKSLAMPKETTIKKPAKGNKRGIMSSLLGGYNT